MQCRSPLKQLFAFYFTDFPTRHRKDTENAGPLWPVEALRSKSDKVGIGVALVYPLPAGTKRFAVSVVRVQDLSFSASFFRFGIPFSYKTGMYTLYIDDAGCVTVRCNKF